MGKLAGVKVAVIGAGVIGLCSAYRLQRQGFEVTIFDGGGVANGASYGNAGHFATEQVFPLANPGLLPQIPKMLFDPLGPFKIQANYIVRAIPWFVRFCCAMTPSRISKNTAAIRALNQCSIIEWRQLLSEINASECLIERGSLLTYESGNAVQLAQDYQQYSSQGVAVEKLTPQQVKQLEPNLSDNVSGALYFCQVGHTENPAQLCDKIFAAFTGLGGQLVKQNIVTITSQFKPLLIETDDQVFSYDKVVVCAGGHSKKIALQLGFDVPLEVERGYHLMLDHRVKLNRPIASADRKFIMTPMADGLRLAGTVEFGGLGNAPDYRRSDMLLTHAKALLPELAAVSLSELTKDARWMGFRPSLPDSLPIIDRSPHNPNVFFNFGHQHLGLTWAAICGELISQLVTNQATKINITPYRITRF